MMAVETVDQPKIASPCSRETVWERAVAVFAQTFTYGDTVPHEWFYTQFGLQRPDWQVSFEEGQRIQLKHLALFEKFRLRLTTQHRMVLKPRDGFGYEVVKPEEQTTFSEREGLRKVRKAVSECRTRLECIALDRLDAVQRAENQDARCRLSMLEHMYRKVAERRSKALADVRKAITASEGMEPGFKQAKPTHE